MRIQPRIGKCYICGSELANFQEERTVECNKCGKSEKTNIACTKGHYLCEKCAGAGTIDMVRGKMLLYKDKDPLAVAEKLMEECGMYGNSPHSLVTASFLVAYRNCTNSISDTKILEGFERAVKIPGGWCGFYGTCGAAVGLGTAFSVITDATPMSDTERSKANYVTSSALTKIAALGGPRCCVSSVRAAIEAGVERSEFLGVNFEKSEWWNKACSYSGQNSDCRKEKCPYYIRKSKGVN